MTVWIVTKQWSEAQSLMDYSEIVGVYSSEEKAREKQEELVNENAVEVIVLGCDEIDVTVEEWEVE